MIETIGVIGAGQMGGGIAHVCALAGYQVKLSDVSQEADCEALLEDCIEHFGHCDILLNNAGIIATGSILDTSTADFDRVLAVNLRGTFLLSRAVAKFDNQLGQAKGQYQHNDWQHQDQVQDIA